MQQHDDHRAAAQRFHDIARAHGFHDLADIVADHIGDAHRATDAFNSKDVHAMAVATADLLSTAEQMLREAADAHPLPADLEHAGRDTMRALGHAVAASC